MSTYLQSDTGGAWLESEIITMYDPFFEEVDTVIHSNSADYTFIYLSGHGYTNMYDQGKFCLSNKEVEDAYFLDKSPRQLLVIDACRNIFRGIGAPGPQPFSPEWRQALTAAVRELFNKCISNSPYGKTIIYSTQRGEPSYDNFIGKGGAFTVALLRSAMSIKPISNSPETVSIEGLFRKIAKTLRNKQMPCIGYKSGSLNVPFVIALPQLEIMKADWPNTEVNANPANKSGWESILGLILLIALFDD